MAACSMTRTATSWRLSPARCIDRRGSGPASRDVRLAPLVRAGQKGHGDEPAALPKFRPDVLSGGRSQPAKGVFVGLAVEAFVGLKAPVVMNQVDAVDGHGRLLIRLEIGLRGERDVDMSGNRRA